MGIGTTDTLTPAGHSRLHQTRTAGLGPEEFHQAILFALRDDRDQAMAMSRPIEQWLNAQTEGNPGSLMQDRKVASPDFAQFAAYDPAMDAGDAGAKPGREKPGGKNPFGDYVQDGENTPGVYLNMSLASKMELQIITASLRLSGPDAIFLRNHLDIADKIRAGQIVYEPEGFEAEVHEMDADKVASLLREEIETQRAVIVNSPDWKVREAMMQAHDAFEHCHVTGGMKCSYEEEVEEHFHHVETCINTDSPAYQQAHTTNPLHDPTRPDENA